jgi:DNA-binding NarL/FixJ family response regulator
MKKINLLLVDDHKIIRDGIKSILHTEKTITIIHEAENGEEAIQYLEKNSKNINIVLMDINMPKMNGIDAVKIISKKYLNIKVLALSMHSEETYILDMIKAGAFGYILKDSSGEKLIEAIQTISEEKKYYSNDVSTTLINSMINNQNNVNSNTTISDREKQVLTNIVKGKTNKEIGEILHISTRTVETHRRNMMQKLEVKNTAEMVRKALEKGIIKNVTI